MADEEAFTFTVRLEIQEKLDERTVNAKCRFKVKKSRFSNLHTVRTYPNSELPRHIHQITNAINNVAVAKSIHLDISESGSTRVFFLPFYKHTFKDWEQSLASETQEVREIKVNKTMRCIIRAIDVLHEYHRYDVGLEVANIRVDDEDNAQIVLDTIGTDSMQVGVPNDIAAYKTLVDNIFSTIGASQDDCYILFNDLYSHFMNRSDRFDENGSLRSFSYFILHNPLFYEVKDKYNCIYKMKMFRDLNKRDFNKNMSSMGMEDWLKDLYNSTVLTNIYNQKYIYYRGQASILAFFYDCYHHGQELGCGIFEIQQEVDIAYPYAVYTLFYYFVVNIESKKVFHDVNVLDYFRSVHPSPDLLE